MAAAIPYHPLHRQQENVYNIIRPLIGRVDLTTLFWVLGQSLWVGLINNKIVTDYATGLDELSIRTLFVAGS